MKPLSYDPLTEKLYFICLALQVPVVIYVAGHNLPVQKTLVVVRNRVNYLLEVQLNLYHAKTKLSFFLAGTLWQPDE